MLKSLLIFYQKIIRNKNYSSNKGVSNSSTVIFDTSEGAIHIEIKQ